MFLTSKITINNVDYELDQVAKINDQELLLVGMKILEYSHCRKLLITCLDLSSREPVEVNGSDWLIRSVMRAATPQELEAGKQIDKTRKVKRISQKNWQ